MRRIPVIALLLLSGCSVFAPMPAIQKATTRALNTHTAFDLVFRERCLGADPAAKPWPAVVCHDAKASLDSLARAINAAKNPDPKAGAPLSIGGPAPEMIQILDERRKAADDFFGGQK